MSNSQSNDTAKNKIYKEIRRSIVLGKFAPGEWLRLDNLAKTYNTSVTPVREALQMLAQEELVTAKPHAGFFITQVTLKELHDLLGLRKILEVAAIEKAAKRITEEQLSQLENVHAGYDGDDD
ncbi:MAG: GntR family transcriptional regulator, partial [Chloroflexota bacterium]|nr:GntR family transcriptional regulator [Chloroflexota bacterium]